MRKLVAVPAHQSKLRPERLLSDPDAGGDLAVALAQPDQGSDRAPAAVPGPLSLLTAVAETAVRWHRPPTTRTVRFGQRLPALEVIALLAHQGEAVADALLTDPDSDRDLVA